MTNPPRLVLADDHTLVAEMLAEYLSPTCDLVAIVGDGRTLVDVVKRQRPDLVIADLSMPGMGGLDALRRLRADGEETKFVFVTMHDDPALASQALKAGASGYLLKNSAGEELLTAIGAVLKGHVYLTPSLAKDVFAATSTPDVSPIDRLTLRQREVLSLVVQGRLMKQIAAELSLSPRTVESHKYEMMNTLGVQTTAELIHFAYLHGFARA